MVDNVESTNSGTVQVSVRVPASCRDAFASYCTEHGLSQGSGFVEIMDLVSECACRAVLVSDGVDVDGLDELLHRIKDIFVGMVHTSKTKVEALLSEKNELERRLASHLLQLDEIHEAAEIIDNLKCKLSFAEEQVTKLQSRLDNAEQRHQTELTEALNKCEVLKQTNHDLRDENAFYRNLLQQTLCEKEKTVQPVVVKDETVDSGKVSTDDLMSDSSPT